MRAHLSKPAPRPAGQQPQTQDRRPSDAGRGWSRCAHDRWVSGAGQI